MKTGRGTRWENTQTFDFNSVIPDVHFRFSRIRFWLVLLASHLITFTLFCNWNCIFCNCQVLNCSFDLGVEFPIERMLIQTDLSTMVGTWINPELHKPYWLQIVGYEFSAAVLIQWGIFCSCHWNFKIVDCGCSNYYRRHVVNEKYLGKGCI